MFLTAKLNIILGRHRDIEAISSTTAKSLPQARVSELAEKVNADAVVEWVIHGTGSEHRLLVRLIDPDQESAIWGGEYGLPSAVDSTRWDEIVSHIARSVSIEIESLRIPLTVSGKEISIDAFQEYLSGLGLLLQTPNSANLERASQHFSNAVESEPAFIHARARYAETLAKQSFREQSEELFQLARSEAEAVLAMHPGFAEAEYALGLALLVGDDEELANSHIRSARNELPYVEFDLELLRRADQGSRNPDR